MDRRPQWLALLSRAYSPRKRGWTAYCNPCNWHGDVFPAQAGMDRYIRQSWAEPHSIPRASGDGPHIQVHFVPFLQYSPRKRGWTDNLITVSAGNRVFPAQAGMDRSNCFIFDEKNSIPRVSGDGPRKRCWCTGISSYSPRKRGWTAFQHRMPQLMRVFPAQAGMDRLQFYSGHNNPSIPRASGDGPFTYEVKNG